MQLSVCVGAHGGKHTVMHINFLSELVILYV